MAVELRPFQRKALEQLRHPGHLVCIAPTGSGKSLIYQRFCAQAQVRAVLVTPLIALARQQAANLERAEIPCTLAPGETGVGPPDGESGIWIISPEKLYHPFKPRAWEALAQWRPNFLIVDECHCLWDWGDDFRPAFAQVPQLLKDFQIPRSLWLTATLTPKARAQLQQQLPNPTTFQGRFRLPPQLKLTVTQIRWSHRVAALVSFVRNQKQAGLIFVVTRHACERVFRLLTQAGVRAGFYHAGMAREERKNVETQVRGGDVQVVVATSAFGMGMDIGHLSWAVLWQPTPSLLQLAQTIGRVGRSQRIGHAWVMWEDEDFRLLEWSTAGRARKKAELLELAQFLRASQKENPRLLLERYFNHRPAVRHSHHKAVPDCQPYWRKTI